MYQELIIVQDGMRKIAGTIGDKEGRFDICVAGAGVFVGDVPSLDYPDDQFQRVSARASPGLLLLAPIILSGYGD